MVVSGINLFHRLDAHRRGRMLTGAKGKTWVYFYDVIACSRRVLLPGRLDNELFSDAQGVKVFFPFLRPVGGGDFSYPKTGLFQIGKYLAQRVKIPFQ